MKEIILESAKEGLRVVVLAILPLVIDGISKGFVDWNFIGVTALIAGLRFVDKLLHELGKVKENENLIKGLTRF